MKLQILSAGAAALTLGVFGTVHGQSYVNFDDSSLIYTQNFDTLPYTANAETNTAIHDWRVLSTLSMGPMGLRSTLPRLTVRGHKWQHRRPWSD